jgi:hypothetical protein
MSTVWIRKVAVLAVLFLIVPSPSIRGTTNGSRQYPQLARGDIRGTIDGSSAPQAIDGLVAYELFLRTLGAAPSAALAREIGLADDNVAYLYDDAHSLRSALEGLESSKPAAAAAAAGDGAVAPSGATPLANARRRIVAQYRDRILPASLGIEDAGKLARYIETHIKSRTKMVPYTALADANKGPNYAPIKGDIYVYSDSWVDGTKVHAASTVLENAFTAIEGRYRVQTAIVSPSYARHTTNAERGAASVTVFDDLEVGREDGDYRVETAVEALATATPVYVASATLFQPVAATITIGTAIVTPSTAIAATGGVATIKVSIGTTSSVPPGSTVQIELLEVSNFDGILYSITPSRMQTITLAGGGASTNATWTLTTLNGNASAGTVVSKAALIADSAVGGTIGMPNMTMNINVQVANPPGGGGGGGTGQTGGCNDPILIAQCQLTGGLWKNCGCYSPIVVDVDGNGIALTNAPGGILFDMAGDGTSEQIAWTLATADDAWLALDRNGNGTIDNGTELFGNYTPQPASDTPNGFLALAEYDKPANGGNSDASISAADTIFASLRLWQDTNHNGISETSELKTLPALGVERIELTYVVSGTTDEHGNRFRYKAKVHRVNGPSDGRWTYDVFLVFQP